MKRIFTILCALAIVMAGSATALAADAETGQSASYYPMGAMEQDEEQRSLRESRKREMEEWLDRQPLCLTEYDDDLTRRFVVRITVVDAETIRVRIRDTDVEIEQKIC